MASMKRGPSWAEDQKPALKTKSGVVLDKAAIEALAAEAEAGYDLSRWKRRVVKPGRPSLGKEGTSPRLEVRLAPGLYQKVKTRASRERRSISALAREAIEKYVG